MKDEVALNSILFSVTIAAGTFFAITAVFILIEAIVAVALAFTGKKGPHMK